MPHRCRSTPLAASRFSVPDATQRLWIAPWVDTDDNFHQPAVVEFVKNKSHWDESYRVIGEGGE
jgi:conjugal transfer pilus assembly protein TraV